MFVVLVVRPVYCKHLDLGRYHSIIRCDWVTLMSLITIASELVPAARMTPPVVNKKYF